MPGVIPVEPKWEKKLFNKKIGEFFNSMRLNKKPKKFRNGDRKTAREDREILRMMKESKLRGEFTGAFARSVEQRDEDEVEEPLY